METAKIIAARIRFLDCPPAVPLAMLALLDLR
jgi:hypothetical protein